MKKTFEEKCNQLRKLSNYSNYAEGWLRAAEQCATYQEFCINNAYERNKERSAYTRLVWDVHTGTVDTKLYKALV